MTAVYHTLTNSMYRILLIVLLLTHFWEGIMAQSVLPAYRRADWSKAGYNGTIPSYPQVSIINFGADSMGNISCNAALTAAISSFAGAPGAVYLPAGNYLFTQAIRLPSNTVLKGAGNTQTQLTFNLNGANDNLITISGNVNSAVAGITMDAAKNATQIIVNNISGFAAGDYIKLSQNDAALVTSSWALGSVGQILQIESINATVITLKSALRKKYSLNDVPQITKLDVLTGSGIECLKIKRLDATTGQTANILIKYAAKCWVRGVESDSCNFAHVSIASATNIEVSGCYFHGAFGYGGNGQGYGVDLEMTTGECLVENNVFRHLRHAMLLQAGVNGNVLSYNYSIEPFWTGVLSPSNAAGDMVLHGNWVYANLFEGNVGQNMVIDNSHGKNGPFNTYFRNRGGTYGIFMNNNAGDSSNIIGNEITHASTGLFYLTGNGNFVYGNNVKGTITPVGSSSLSNSSLYRNTPPYYFFVPNTFPSIGLPNNNGSGTIPAVMNYNAGTPCNCNSTTIILPIVLKSFTAFANGCNAMLQWTANDENGDHYTIESSSDGLHFTTLKIVNADGSNGGSVYSFTLLQPDVTKWYRLKMTGKNEGIAYSRIAPVSNRCNKQAVFTVHPNPVSDQLTINYEATTAGQASIWVNDAAGKTVVKKDIAMQTGANSWLFDMQALPPGLYYLQLRNGNRAEASQKVIKK